jgi:thiamine biosynthesis lipoprotein
VRFLAPGVEINLGGIGKGYALDRCADLLRAAGIEDFLIHGGQSSVLAVGSHPATPGQGWNIGLRHPLRPDRRLAEFFLRDQALGTSGSGTQFFHHRGKRYGHLLDPRTGRPADGVLSATVLAPDAAEADALATAFYVLGPEAAATYGASHDGIATLLATPGPKQGSVELHAHGLAEDAWQSLVPNAPG